MAFEEQPSSKHFGTAYEENPPPLYPDAQTPPSSTVAKRARAPADPFSDTPPPSRSIATHSSFAATAVKLSEEPLSPTAAMGYDISKVLQMENSGDEDMEEEYMRIWTSPDLANPEILQLLGLFPSFVSRRILPRFQVTASRPTDIEGGEDADGKIRVRFGTGSMWISSRQRGDGWNGSWWTRFVHWWKRLFC